MRRALRVVGWLLAGLLALLVLLGLGIAALLGTDGGSRWALGQVPGLELDNFEGRLAGRWQADQLRWQQGDSEVRVAAPRMDWNPACLLRRTLCIEELRTGDIHLVFPPAEEPASAEPFSLPELKLPLRLQVERIETGRILLNGEEQLQALQLRADWRNEGLVIHELQLRREDIQAELSGRLQPSGQWPLELRGDASIASPAPDQPWTLNLALQGDLRDELGVNLQSRGYLTANLNGQLRPLDETLPARLQLSARDFLASPDLPEALRVDDLRLSAEGSLQNGYQLKGEGQLAGEGGPVRLLLDGLLRQDGARVERLELDAGQEQRVRLSGDFGWQDSLSADARLAWADFPWQRLYPGIEAPPVALHTLAAQLQYEDGNYLGHFDAALSGPAGDFSLQSPVSGDLEQVHLPQLELVAGQGRASGNLSVGFADGIDWNTELALAELDPAYWLAELPGRLGGSLRSQGALRDGALQAEADLQLDGRLRGQPARLQLQGSGADQRWNLAALDFSLGDNRIRGSGALADMLEANLSIDLQRLGQLWPGLEGRLAGDLQAGGTLDAPDGRLALQGSALAFQDNRLASLSLAASLEDGERGQLQASASELRAGETDLGRLQLEAGGSLAEHRAELQMQGGLLDLALALDGGLQGEDWRGRLLSAELDAQQQNWALQAPAELARLADGTLTLGAHCFTSGPARLCGEQQRLMPEPRLRYRLSDFPLASLASYLPENFAWQGELNANLELDMPAAGPNGVVEVDAGPGVLRLRDGETWHDFPYGALALESRLKPGTVDSRLRFAGGELGELEVQLSVDPTGERKPISGSFILRDLDISVARPFVEQVDRLQGQLTGEGRLTGSLTQPQINGQLTLADAEISGSELPVSFEQLQLRAFIEGERVRLDGGWRSGEQGTGQLDGIVDWGGELDVDVRLLGERLPVVVEPYAELEVAPNLRLVLEEGRLAVIGEVKVPRGEIQVRELPPSTVRVSEDVVIVGEEAQAQEQPLEIAMDVNVEVGQDRLRFSGFGLTADLAGYLHIGDNLDTRGELQLKNGRYRAYGQRLTIRRARLLFTGPLSQPFLDIEAIRRIEAENVIAGLRITGSAEQPRVDVFSEPAMSQEQALAYLITGRALGAGTGDSNLLAQAALGLGLAGSSGLTGGLAQRLGIDDFQLDTEGGGDDTSVVASGRITDRLTLRYGVGVFEPVNTVALRYQLTKRIFLEAASGLASSLDIFYRRDF